MRLSSPYDNIGNNFLGYAENGNFESKDEITYLPIADGGGPTYYFFKNFILHEGHTLTTISPCCGLYIYVREKAIVNGTITMTDRGIYSPPEGEYENGYIPLGMNNVFTVIGSKEFGLSPLVTPANTNAIKDSGSCGGGSGHIPTPNNSSVYGGFGGCAGLFSGGSGGGASWYGNVGTNSGVRLYGTDAEDYGGKAGVGAAFHDPSNWSAATLRGGSGAGNPGYKFTAPGNNITWVPSDENTGTGGVLYFICNSLNTIGYFESRGHNPTGSSGSGGSGGGSITILYRQLFGDIKVNVNAVTRGYSGSSRVYHIN